MSIKSFLQDKGGCAGGRLVYYAAQTSAALVTIGRKTHKLDANAKAKLGPLFPGLNLSKVRFKTGCSLPGNWFEKGSKVDAMTFGYFIYFKGKYILKSDAKLNLLMHELVHVDQVRRYGSEHKFACEYGKGYLAAGSYRSNPLEVEAYDFVATFGF
jgi:Domain of unknown function (DUF4157)